MKNQSILYKAKQEKITVTVENKDKDGLDTLASTLIKKDIPDKELEMEIENSNGIKIPVNFKNIVRKMYNICNTCYNIGINEMYKDIVKDIIAYKDKVYGIQELKYIIDNRYPKSNTDKKLNNLEYDTMYFILYKDSDEPEMYIQTRYIELYISSINSPSSDNRNFVISEYMSLMESSHSKVKSIIEINLNSSNLETIILYWNYVRTLNKQ